MAGTLKTGLWRCQDLASATPCRSILRNLDPQTRSRAQPHESEPGSDIPGSLFVPGSLSGATFARSWSAPIPRSGVQPGPPGSIFALKMSETRLSSGRSTGSSPPSDTFTSPTHGADRHTDCFRFRVVGHFQPKGLVQLREERRIGVVEQRRDLAQRLDQRIYVL